jgi:hypothetical protein
MHKCTVFLLITCLVVSCLIVHAVAPVSAQTGYKPSIPQFTVKLIDYSYDVPPSTTTAIDQYTGEKVTTTTPGYHVENKTIEITIKNQPFTPYADTNGITYYLYYTVQSKGRFGEDWQNWGSTVQTKSPYGGGFTPSPEYSQGSIVSSSANGYANGAQVDFRVEAIIGHYVPQNPDSIAVLYWFETDVSSGWSSVQTITIPNTPSQTAATLPPVTSDGNGQPQYPGQTHPPTSIFTNPLFTFGIGALFAGIVITVVMVVLRRHIKTPTYTNNLPQTDTHIEP